MDIVRVELNNNHSVTIQQDRIMKSWDKCLWTHQNFYQDKGKKNNN